MSNSTEHPFLTHFMRNANDGVRTPPTPQVWDAPVWVLQHKTQRKDYPTDRLITVREIKPKNGEKNSKKVLYVVGYLDEDQARKKARDQGHFENEPVQLTVRELFDTVEDNYIHGGITYFHKGEERTVFFDQADVTAYYDFSHGALFEGTPRDYIRSMPKRPQTLKRGDMRKICEELDTIGLPMGIDIYAVDGINGPQTFIDFSPRRALENDELPQFAKSIRVLRETIAKGCTFTSGDPTPLVKDETLTDAEKVKVQTTRFHESSQRGMVSFELEGRSRESEAEFVDEEKPTDPLSVHLDADSQFIVMTPFKVDVLDQQLFVPRLRVKVDGFDYEISTKTEMGSSLVLMDAFLYRDEALKKCSADRFDDEPDVLTVRELLKMARQRKIGIDYHFLPDEVAYRKEFEGDEQALANSTLSIGADVIKIYSDFVERATPAPESHVSFIRNMPKAEGVLTRRVHNLILESLPKSGLEGDFDVYYIDRLGNPCVVIDMTTQEKMTERQRQIFERMCTGLEKKIQISVLGFSLYEEHPPRPDRDQEPVFKKSSFTLPIEPNAALKPDARIAPADRDAVDAITRELGLKRVVRDTFRLPGLDTN